MKEKRLVKRQNPELPQEMVIIRRCAEDQRQSGINELCKYGLILSAAVI